MFWEYERSGKKRKRMPVPPSSLVKNETNFKALLFRALKECSGKSLPRKSPKEIKDPHKRDTHVTNYWLPLIDASFGSLEFCFENIFIHTETGRQCLSKMAARMEVQELCYIRVRYFSGLLKPLLTPS
jgi:hypothetical protein